MPERRIDSKTITIFWVPLLLTWFMMSIEGPLVSAIIARLGDMKFNLAAYGVAVSIGFIVEAPIVMILSAVVALAKGRESFSKLRKFLFTLNIGITLAMLFILIPPVFRFISRSLLHLPIEIEHLTYIATALMLPWGPAIGYRRLYQGILISNNQTRKVTYGTLFRLGGMAFSAFSLAAFTNLPGAFVGTASLSAGVVLEAIATRMMASGAREKIMSVTNEASSLRYSFIARFYYPLVLTSLIHMGVRPAVVFFLGQAPHAIESLAVFPVINSFVFIFSCVGVSILEADLALMGEKNQNYPVLRRYSYMLTLICSLIFAAVAFTPLSGVWFQTVSGLSDELTVFAILPVMLMLFIPPSAIIMSLQRAVMMKIKETKPIQNATIIEAIGVILPLYIMIYYFGVTGIVAASIAMVAGRIAANSYLFHRQRKAEREGRFGPFLTETPQDKL